MKHLFWPKKEENLAKGHPSSVDLRYREEDSYSHSTVVLVANSGYIFFRPPLSTQEISSEMKLKYECYDIFCFTGEVVFVQSD